MYYPFGNGVFHLFVPSMLTYLAMWGLREKAGKIAWLIDFTYLIGWYLTLLISICYNLWLGKDLEKNLFLFTNKIVSLLVVFPPYCQCCMT